MESWPGPGPQYSAEIVSDTAAVDADTKKTIQCCEGAHFLPYSIETVASWPGPGPQYFVEIDTAAVDADTKKTIQCCEGAPIGQRLHSVESH